MIFNGKEFKNRYKDIRFYKLTFKDEIHNRYYYRDGLNIDHYNKHDLIQQHWENERSYKGSNKGIHFTDSYNLLSWLKYNGEKTYWIRKVEIYDDSTIVVYKNNVTHVTEYVTDKIFLYERIEIFGNEKSHENIVKINGLILEYIDEYYQTENICKLAILQNPESFYYVKNRNENIDICKFAVICSGKNLAYIDEKNRTEELCKLAVQEYGTSIKYIEPKYQTKELCKLAIMNFPHSIKHIKNQTNELCELAVNLNGCEIANIKNQTEKLCKLAIDQTIYAFNCISYKNQTNKICKYAVEKYGKYILYEMHDSLITDELCQMVGYKNYMEFIEETEKARENLFIKN